MKKYIRNSNHLNIATKPDCLEKFIWTAHHLHIAKKLIFFLNLYIFTALYLLVGNRLNLDPDSNPDPNPELITDPDPNLQIIFRMHNTGEN
jgi:hypothetical protein